MGALKVRVEALFQNEIKKQLRGKRDELFSNIKSKQGNNGIINKLEKKVAYLEIFAKLPDALLEVGNIAVEDFEQEIKGVRDPQKSHAIELLRVLILTDIQELIKDSTKLF
jgi:hypothetical protein